MGLLTDVYCICQFSRDKLGSSGPDKNVAGVVASMNNTVSQFYSSVVLQKGSTMEEFEDDLCKAVSEAASRFCDLHAGDWPDKVIIYRDGVNTGLVSGAGREAQKYARALSEMSAEVVKCVVVVVQKRIDAKFYSEARNQMENPAAGTVLDHTVTSRDHYDFYLVPMSTNLGTVTPVHHVVIHDDTEMNPQTVQRLTFVLGAGYFNWPGYVRVPSVCQYAHKLVELTGEHTHHAMNPKMQNSLFYL